MYICVWQYSYISPLCCGSVCLSWCFVRLPPTYWMGLYRAAYMCLVCCFVFVYVRKLNGLPPIGKAYFNSYCMCRSYHSLSGYSELVATFPSRGMGSYSMCGNIWTYSIPECMCVYIHPFIYLCMCIFPSFMICHVFGNTSHCRNRFNTMHVVSIRHDFISIYVTLFFHNRSQTLHRMHTSITCVGAHLHAKIYQRSMHFCREFAALAHLGSFSRVLYLFAGHVAGYSGNRYVWSLVKVMFKVLVSYTRANQQGQSGQQG